MKVLRFAKGLGNYRPSLCQLPYIHTAACGTHGRSSTHASRIYLAGSRRVVGTGAKSLSMATNGIGFQDSALESLTTKLHALGVKDLPNFPNAYPTYNPVDIYRAHITETLAPITGVDASIIYPAIQWTSTLDKGDALLAVPALRIKGKKPDETAKLIGEQVRLLH